ncbi:MAG: DUF1080 domain-containing protein [Planctomycetaceae bacterium]
MQADPTSSTPASRLKSSSSAGSFATFVSAAVLVLVILLVNRFGSTPRPVVATVAGSGWTSLFDGKSLEGWKITDFGGQGDVRVEDGAILLELGNDLTGVTRESGVPTINYEVELEAMRVDGADFFCGLTFPVKNDACSLILGGWGGGLVGLSSLDGFDASENETSSYREFENGKWYRVRLKVTEARIEAWIDDEQIIDADIANRRVSVRIEIELSRPFGLATWRTKGAIRNIRVRPLAA